jgi:hypothetical protein
MSCVKLSKHNLGKTLHGIIKKESFFLITIKVDILLLRMPLEKDAKTEEAKR